MGERLVLEQLYGRHAQGVRRYLTRLVGNHDAEDLTHDVFEKAQRALNTHRADSRLSTWLYRIATHAAVDRLRHRSIQERDRAATVADETDPLTHATCPDREIALTKTRACILRLVDRLPASQKAVVLLGELRGLSDRDTADTLGITVATAKIRLHRARRQLRDLMQSECQVYRDERDGLGCEPKTTSRSPRAIR